MNPANVKDTSDNSFVRYLANKTTFYTGESAQKAFALSCFILSCASLAKYSFQGKNIQTLSTNAISLCNIISPLAMTQITGNDLNTKGSNYGKNDLYYIASLCWLVSAVLTTSKGKSITPTAAKSLSKIQTAFNRLAIFNVPDLFCGEINGENELSVNKFKKWISQEKWKFLCFFVLSGHTLKNIPLLPDKARTFLEGAFSINSILENKCLPENLPESFKEHMPQLVEAVDQFLKNKNLDEYLLTGHAFIKFGQLVNTHFPNKTLKFYFSLFSKLHKPKVP